MEKVSKQITIRAPLGGYSAEAHVSKFVSANLTHEQGAVLKGLLVGLNAEDARLANGKHVTSAADVVRWLLEQGISR